MKSIKSLIVLPLDPSAQGGGISRVVTYFSREAEREDGLKLALFPTLFSSRFPFNLLSMPPRFAAFLWSLPKERPDIVHIHVAPRGSTWRKAVYCAMSRAFGKPVVLHLHGSGYNEYFAAQSPMAQRLIRLFFHSAKAVIVLGTGWRDWAISDDGLALASENVHIIDNGVPAPTQLAQHKNDVPRIVFVGLVGHRKGVDTLVAALAKLPTDAQWTCAICGNGEVEKYQAEARAAGLKDSQVEFTGWQDEQQVQTQMANADIYVLPSRAENQPVAILEAMAVGLPVISTAIGDIPNQVQDAKTGYVVEPGNADLLAAALGTLIADSDKRKSMGKAGRQRFEDHYSSRANLEKTIAVYQDILD